MIKTIDFYFDFISPYSYIAHQKIKSIKANKVKFNYKPILLGGLHKLGEITAPAFNEQKMKNMRNDCELISKKNNIFLILIQLFTSNESRVISEDSEHSKL